MRLSVLGPVSVRNGDTWQTIGSAKCRSVLAHLLVQAPEPLSSEQLIDLVWDDPPRTAPTQIHGYVSRIRRLLDDPDGQILVTQGAGYRISLAPGDLDADVFSRTVAAGIEDLHAERFDRATEQLQDALALWTGAPFTDGPDTERIEAVRSTLALLRLDAEQALIEIELVRGRPAAVIPRLRELIEQHPYREQFRRQLMLALHHSDRSTEALQEYQALQALLREELGTDPSESVRSTHQDILTATAATSEVADAADTSESLTIAERVKDEPVAQLPSPPVDFVGQERLVDEVVTLLSAAESGRAPSVVVLHGPPGVGKSAVALQAARRLRSVFPDVQLYLDLHATTTRPHEPTDLLADLLRCLGVVGNQLPASEQSRSGLLRGLLSDRRSLLVLDNVGPAERLQTLLPAEGQAAVLLTSRHALTGSPSAAHLVVNELPEAASRTLFTNLVGADRVEAEPREADDIVEACGGLPLALRIAAGKLTTRPQWSLGELATRLRRRPGRLAELSFGDLDLRATVRLSVDALSPTARHGFELLALVEHTDFPGWLLGPLLGRDRADDVLDELLDAGLLRVGGTDELRCARYELGPVLREYALERLTSLDEPTVTQARRRLLSAWLSAAHTAVRSTPPSLHDPLFEVSPPPEPVAYQAVEHPWAWLKSARAGVLAATRSAAEHEPDLCWRLAASLVPFFDEYLLYDDWARTHRLALEVNDGEVEAEAVLLRGLAQLHQYRDRSDEAENLLHDSLARFRRLDHARGVALATLSLSTVLRSQGRLPAAERAAREAVHRCVDLHDPSLSAAARGALATVTSLLHRPEEAAAEFARALTDAQAAGDGHREAVLLRRRAALEFDLADRRSALESLATALRLLENVDDELCRANTLAQRGEVLLAVGDVSGADIALRQADEVFRRHQASPELLRCRRLLATIESAAADHATTLTAVPDADPA